MRRLALAAALLLAACDSAPRPVITGPRLHAERAASFREAEAPGRQAAFSPDGRLLATSSASGLVVLRNMPDLKIVRRLHHPGGATALAFDPGGRWLAVAGYDGAVRLWDIATGRLVRKLAGARGTLWTLDVSPDGGRLAAAGEDGIVRLWSPGGGRSRGMSATSGRSASAPTASASPAAASTRRRGSGTPRRAPRWRP
jgi:WD40 repeat protein